MRDLPPPKIASWGDLPRAIQLAREAGAIQQAYLLQQLSQGRIAYLPVLPDTSARKFKAWAALVRNMPALALLGDDDGVDRGPERWALAKRAVAWCASVLIHGAGAKLEHYVGAVEAAEVRKRVLIVECSSATIDQWVSLVADAAHRPSTLIIRTPPGVPHPAPRSEVVH